MDNFVKSPQLLEENYRYDDLLGFSESIADFRKSLDSINTNSVVGLVGKFGSGKSTMLYQLYKESAIPDTEHWIVFDAWKYPERKDLWEGFVLDVAKNIDKKLFDNARKKIDGTNNADIQSLINVIFSGFNYFLPGAGIGKNFASLFKSSPARRVFEFQEILYDFVKKTNKNLFFIVEDIDRSGDRGVYFLETLRYFIKENNFDGKLIVIVPIGNIQYKENQDSYLKTLDYKFDFDATKLDFKNFISEIFDDSICKNNLFLVQMNFLFRDQVKYITIRELKHIIRLASIKFHKFSEDIRTKIDIRMFILFEIERYKDKNVSYQITNAYYQNISKTRSDFNGNNFIIMVANDLNTDDLKNYKTGIPIYFAEGNFKPKYIEGFKKEESGYFLSDVYLK